MIVSDIYQDLVQILTYGDQPTILSRLSDAVEVLNNKGDFDALLGYVVIRPVAARTGGGTIITLPPDVKTPIKVNINDIPSMARDRWYEYTLNGPGTNSELVGWQWVDRGAQAVFAQPPAISALLLTGNMSDNGKTVTVTGRTDTLGTLKTVVYTLGEMTPSTVQFNYIDSVIKQVSANPMTLSDTHSNVLSVYTATETEPQYRQITISKPTPVVSIQFRRTNFRVTQLTDTIPIHSKMGIILMVKAIESYRNGYFESGATLEATAIKYANEEQAGHDKNIEVATTSQKSMALNLTMGDRDNLVVSDIYDEVSSALGPISQFQVFDRITGAVQTIRNAMLAKGEWDLDVGYLAIQAVTNLVSLPREVDSPIKINLNSNPAFGRDKLYEFMQDGPGEDAPRVGWSWEDKGFSPLMVPLTVPNSIYVFGLPADNDAVISITGIQPNTGASLTTDLEIGGTSGTPVLAQVTRVFKPITTAPVSITTPDGALLAEYLPNEQEPTYRQIRVSVAPAALYITYRKKNTVISSLSDEIPVRSREAVILMIQALQMYRDGKDGSALEAKAIDLAMNEQKSQNAFSDISGSTEKATVLNLSYNNEDSVIVADVYDEVSGILGPVGQPHVFDVITEARTVLGRKCQWDSLRGFVDINTDQYHYVTLPRYVESVIKMNVCGWPSTPRNQWYQFHLNGPGSRDYCIGPNEWRDIGTVVTLRDVPYAVRLNAVPDSPSDDGGFITVYGYFRGREIQSQDQAGNYSLGMSVQIDSTGALVAPALVDRITRITKPVTNSFVQLIATDSTAVSPPFNVGYYSPDETEPQYRRIRINRSCTQVRIMYRLRSSKITSLTDPLHLRSKSAITCMVRALKLIKDGGDMAAAEAMEMKATKFLMEEQAINNQSDELTVETPRSFQLSRKFMPS